LRRCFMERGESVDGRQWGRMQPVLDSCLDRYASRSGRTDQHGHPRRFVHGLLAGGAGQDAETHARAREYAELIVWFPEEGSPAPEAERLFVRRSLGQDVPIQAQHGNASVKCPFAKLAHVGGSRWTIEEDSRGAIWECGPAPRKPT